MACTGIPVEATYPLSRFRKTWHVQVATSPRSHITARGRAACAKCPGLAPQHRAPEASATATLSSSWPSLRPLIPSENNECSKIKSAILRTSANGCVIARRQWVTQETLLVTTINAREQGHPHLYFPRGLLWVRCSSSRCQWEIRKPWTGAYWKVCAAVAVSEDEAETASWRSFVPTSQPGKTLGWKVRKGKSNILEKSGNDQKIYQILLLFFFSSISDDNTSSCVGDIKREWGVMLG